MDTKVKTNKVKTNIARIIVLLVITLCAFTLFSGANLEEVPKLSERLDEQLASDLRALGAERIRVVNFNPDMYRVIIYDDFASRWKLSGKLSDFRLTGEFELPGFEILFRGDDIVFLFSESVYGQHIDEVHRNLDMLLTRIIAHDTERRAIEASWNEPGASK